MKKMISTLFALCLCWLLPAQTGRPLTFDEALQITMTGNPQISASQYEEQAAMHERKAAFGLRLPQLNVTGAYVYMGDDIGIDLNGVRDEARTIYGGLPSMGITLPPQLDGVISASFNQNWEYKIQDRDFASVGGTVTLPLFMGGKINAANRAARIKEETAKESGRQVEGALMSELVERYYGLLLANHAVEVRRQVVEAMKTHLSDAVAMENEGMIARSERLYVEVKMAEAERDLMAAQLQVETTLAGLCNTLNYKEQYRPVSTMFVLSELPQLGMLQEQAINNNPQLRQVALKRDLAEEGVKAQRAEFMPEVVAMGAASFYNYQVSKALPNWVVGGGVSWKIFDGTSREHKFSAAKHTVRQVEALQVKYGNDIAVLVEKLYNEMLSYRDRMASIETSLEFSEEYLRVKNAAFLEGMSTSVDVIDAELNLASTRIEKLKNAYNYDLTLAKLLEAAGMSERFTDYARGRSSIPVKYE